MLQLESLKAWDRGLNSIRGRHCILQGLLGLLPRQSLRGRSPDSSPPPISCPHTWW